VPVGEQRRAAGAAERAGRDVVEVEELAAVHGPPAARAWRPVAECGELPLALGLVLRAESPFGCGAAVAGHQPVLTAAVRGM
jgi:hypothetical protein